MMMTARKKTSLRFMLVILSAYRKYTVISPSCLKEWRLANTRNMSEINIWQKKLYRTHKSPKAGLGLRTDTRKSAKDNRLQSKNLVEALHGRLSTQQIDIQLFCLTFHFHFRGELQHVGDVSEQKVKYGPIRTLEITDIRLLHELYDRPEHRIKKKDQKRFWKRLLQNIK